MKVIYRSALDQAEKELRPGEDVYFLPGEANALSFQAQFTEEKDSTIYMESEQYEGEWSEIPINAETNVRVYTNSIRHDYHFKAVLQELPEDYAATYDAFAEEVSEYKAINGNDMIRDLMNGMQKHCIAAFDRKQITRIHDISVLLQELTKTLPHLVVICQRPNSHLRDVNEVRPIDTVKRIGYESIPYLASHSEDWQARTSSGLKPARLFARVEESDFAIYENRVVKTLIDELALFLRKEREDLREKSEQRKAIGDSNDVDSFGYDAQHAIVLSKMLFDDDFERICNKGGEIENLLKQLSEFIGEIEQLRESKLYRLLRHTKKVVGELNPTNMLKMHKDYKYAYKLWPLLKTVMGTSDLSQKLQPDWRKVHSGYRDFCMLITQIVLESLQFEHKGNEYTRGVLTANINELPQVSKFIPIFEVVIGKRQPYSVQLTTGLMLPDSLQTEFPFLQYRGNNINVHRYMTREEIEDFHRFLKDKASSGKGYVPSEVSNRLLRFRQRVEEENNKNKSEIERILVVCIPFSLQRDRVQNFKDLIEGLLQSQNKKAADKVYDRTICCFACKAEAEKNNTQYGWKKDENGVALLPVTRFDLNSYRRVRNILLQAITALSVDHKECPNCGASVRARPDGRYICINCKMIIATPECRNCTEKYTYLSYDVKPEIRKSMSETKDEDDFNRIDSMYKYKNITKMKIADKILPVCPHCGKHSE